MEEGAMPKENTNCTAINGFRAEVSWSSEGEYVQLGTVNEKSTATVRDDSESEPETLFGWFITLDRAACNRLIHSLRRARDSAFGKDA